MMMSRHQTAEQNHNTKRDDKSFENVVNFKHFGAKITNQIQFTKKLRTDYIWGMLVIF
jgi:hypothetical protein